MSVNSVLCSFAYLLVKLVGDGDVVDPCFHMGGSCVDGIGSFGEVYR